MNLMLRHRIIMKYSNYKYDEEQMAERYKEFIIEKVDVP